MDEELRLLKRQIGDVNRNARGHRQYSEELRIEIVQYVLRRIAGGYPQAAIARELGLTQRTVWGWVRRTRGDTFKPVELIDDRETQRSTSRTLVLTGGAR